MRVSESIYRREMAPRCPSLSRPGRWVQWGILLIVMMCSSVLAAVATADTSTAIQSLVAVQDAGSGWGADGQRPRASATAVEALGAVSATLRATTTGRLALQSLSASTTDAEAQRVLAGVGDGSQLLAARNASDSIAGRPNAAEGGWGIAPGFASDSLDTAVALRALALAQVPVGIDLVSQTIASGSFDVFSTDVPAAATTIVALLQAVDAAGHIHVRITAGTPPTLADPFFNFQGPIVGPVTLSGIPFSPGSTYFVRVDGVTTSSVYSLALQFSGPGVDSAAVSEPLAYLRASQNLDGGLGLQPSDDSLVGVTAQAILASQALPNQATPDVAAAVSFLEGRQLGDGSLGTVSETALAYRALVEFAPASASALAAYNFLVGAQWPDGSWGGAAQTAHALLALLKPPTSVDGDRDGLKDAYELAHGFDPLLVDSDGDGTLDGDEDPDGDGQNLFAEQALGTDPLLADSDGDGFDDGVELAEGGDPRSGFVTVELLSGFSLFAYPTAVAPGTGAFDLLTSLGVGGVDEEIARLDPLTGLFETANVVGGIPSGTDFPISTAEGYAIQLDTSGTFHFPGAPDTPTLDLQLGSNLVGLPSAPPGLTAFTLLQAIGDDSVVQSISSFDSAKGAFETASYSTGAPVGVNFPIERGRGYLVSMRQPLLGFAPPLGPSITIDDPLDGAQVATATVDVSGSVDLSAISVDVNGVGAQLSSGQYAALAVPLVLGSNTLTATASDGQGLVGMATAQVRLNFAPQITITSPADLAVITSSPVVVSGSVMDDEAVTVAVNGVAAAVDAGTFAASVPLSMQGSNLITAVATDPFGDIGVDSISVILSSVDYSIAIGGQVNDTRIFTGAQELLDQAALFTVSQIGVPAGVTYTTTSVTRISATEMEVGFNIAVGAGAALGTTSFQVDYGLLDSGSNPLTPLFGDVFDFDIEVLP